MATFKYLILTKEPNKEGKFQIYMQVTHMSRSLLIGMKHAVDLKNWMVKGRDNIVKLTNSTHLNSLLTARELDAVNTVIEWEKENRKYTSAEIKAYLSSKWGIGKIAPKIANELDNAPSADDKLSNLFFDYANEYLENMKKSKKQHYKSDKTRIKHFRDFLNGQDITFDDITVSLLQSYKAYLSHTLKVGLNLQKPVSARTIENHILTLRTVYNKAKANGVTKLENYPFGKGKLVVKFPETSKIGLNNQEVKILEDFANSIPSIKDFSFISENKVNNGLNQRLTALKKKNPNAELNAEDKVRLAEIDRYRNEYLKHALNVWMLSFYCAGIRISDVLLLKWSDFQDGRLYYTMGKNNKAGSIKINPKMQAILNQYNIDQPKHDLVFPELKILPNLSDRAVIKLKVANADSRINKALEKVRAQLKISKKITAHVSRHTFGTIAGDKISIQKLQALYRHTNISTTVNYQGNFMHKDTDDALDKVIGS